VLEARKRIFSALVTLVICGLAVAGHGQPNQCKSKGTTLSEQEIAEKLVGELADLVVLDTNPSASCR
jgi:hypothetical protein